MDFASAAAGMMERTPTNHELRANQMSKTRSWVVTTSGDRPVKEVARDLETKGFSVEQVLDEIGAITGAADDDVAATARTIEGVADVSPDGAIDIGPPGAPTTW